jgi:hypothetical protein
MKIIEPLCDEKTENASRVRGRIVSILDYAKVRDWREGETPVDGANRPRCDDGAASLRRDVPSQLGAAAAPTIEGTQRYRLRREHSLRERPRRRSAATHAAHRIDNRLR